jgi:hypothetical protein
MKSEYESEDSYCGKICGIFCGFCDVFCVIKHKSHRKLKDPEGSDRIEIARWVIFGRSQVAGEVLE